MTLTTRHAKQLRARSDGPVTQFTQHKQKQYHRNPGSIVGQALSTVLHMRGDLRGLQKIPGKISNAMRIPKQLPGSINCTTKRPKTESDKNQTQKRRERAENHLYE